MPREFFERFKQSIPEIEQFFEDMDQPISLEEEFCTNLNLKLKIKNKRFL